MGEPALQNYDDDDTPSTAYDRAKQQWGMEPGQEGEAPEEPKKSARERADDRWGTGNDDEKQLSPDKLKEAEGQPDDGASDGSEKGNDKESNWVARTGNGSGPSKKKKIFGGIAGVAATGGIIGFLVLIPAAKLNIMLSQVDDRAMAAASNAIQNRISRYVEKMLVAKITGYGNGTCGNVIVQGCVVAYNDSSIAGNVFRGWQDSRFEEKLWDRLGLDIERDTARSSYTVRDRMGRRINITDGELQRGGFLRRQGSNELGKEINKVIKRETKWYEVMERRSLRKGLKRRFDLDRWCFLYCRDRDELRSRYSNAKDRVKYKMVERIIYPISEKYGIIFDCIINAENCTSERLNERRGDRVSREAVEEIIDKLDLGTRQGERLGQVIVRIIISKVMGPAAGRSAASAIPIAGQVYAGIQAADLLNEIWYGIRNNTMGKYAADINANQYVAFFSAMRSSNDEMKSGLLDFGEVGAVMSEFEGAEQSKIYQAYQPSTSTASLFPKTYAEPADPYKCVNGEPIPQEEFVCNEKKITKSFFFEDWADSTVGDIIDRFSTYEAGCNDSNRGGLLPPHCIRAVIHGALQGINWALDSAVSAVLNPAMSLATTLFPPFGDFKDYVTEKFGEIMNVVLEKIFPMPLTADSKGREKFDALHGGGEVTAMEFGKGGYSDDGESFGMGGVALTDRQSRGIMEEYMAQKEYEQNNNGLYAKLFDINNPQSFMSSAIMASPTTTQGIVNLFSGTSTSVLSGGFLGSIASVFTAKTHAYDARIFTTSPFGVQKYGYATDDESLDIDPDELTPERCEEYKTAREASMTINPDTGFEEYSVADPCLLEFVAAEAAAGLFTTAYDDAFTELSGGDSGGSSTAGATFEGDPFEASESVNCASGTNDVGIHDAYNEGRLVRHRLCAIPGLTNPSVEIPAANGLGVVNSRVSGAVLAMVNDARGDGVTLSAASTFRTMDKQRDLWIRYGQDTARVAEPGYSPHQSGVAIDFEAGGDGAITRGANCTTTRDRATGDPRWDWLLAHAPSYGYKQYAAESWHWDPMNSENRCG